MGSLLELVSAKPSALVWVLVWVLMWALVSDLALALGWALVSSAVGWICTANTALHCEHCTDVMPSGSRTCSCAVQLGHVTWNHCMQPAMAFDATAELDADPRSCRPANFSRGGEPRVAE